jgi:uncharacterized protein
MRSSGLLAMWARSWPAKRLLQAGIGLHLACRPGCAWTCSARAAEGGGDPPPAAMAKFLAGVHADSAQYAGSFTQSFVQNAKDYWEFVFDAFTQWPPTWPLTGAVADADRHGPLQAGRADGRRPRPEPISGLIGVGLGALVDRRPGRDPTTWPADPSLASARHGPLAAERHRARGQPGLSGPDGAWRRGPKGWKAIPAVLAPVGQMAFTNYLMQSILMTTAAVRRPRPGLYGKVDRPAWPAIVVAIWLLQILWSRWWMARFTMGPLEWLWRLAYRGPMPLRRERGEAAPEHFDPWIGTSLCFNGFSGDRGGRKMARGLEEGVERGVDHGHGHRVAQALGLGLADAGGGVAGDLGQVGLALHQVLELGLLSWPAANWLVQRARLALALSRAAWAMALTSAE